MKSREEKSYRIALYKLAHHAWFETLKESPAPVIKDELVKLMRLYGITNTLNAIKLTHSKSERSFSVNKVMKHMNNKYHKSRR